MKKTFIFGLMAAALGFTACSSEDDAVLGENTQKKGMELNVTVAQTAETRAEIDATTNPTSWAFHFAENDQVRVTNGIIGYTDYYTFKKDATSFKSTDAQTTAEVTKWLSYYPSENIDLTSQTGELTGEGKSVANLYALAGATTEDVTGEGTLSIDMQPKVAIIKINNLKGAIDIKVKTTDNYVVGLTAWWTNAKFKIEPSTIPNSFLTKSTTGTYYIVVPADAPLNIYDGDTKLKSTTGLTAGKYYELTVNAAPAFGTGTAEATIGGSTVNVGWVQLWEGGPKFADRNVGANSATDEGTTKTFIQATADPFEWGSNWCTPSKSEMDELLKAATSAGSEKVTCTYTEKNGVYGYEFTGSTAGYESNSVFFPAQNGDDAFYWSGTDSGGQGCCMRLYYEDDWYSNWFEYPMHYDYLVRPVLKN